MVCFVLCELSTDKVMYVIDTNSQNLFTNFV